MSESGSEQFMTEADMLQQEEKELPNKEAGILREMGEIDDMIEDRYRRYEALRNKKSSEKNYDARRKIDEKMDELQEEITELHKDKTKAEKRMEELQNKRYLFEIEKKRLEKNRNKG